MHRYLNLVSSVLINCKYSTRGTVDFALELMLPQSSDQTLAPCFIQLWNYSDIFCYSGHTKIPMIMMMMNL